MQERILYIAHVRLWGVIGACPLYRPGRAMNVKSAVFECGFVRSAVYYQTAPITPR